MKNKSLRKICLTLLLVTAAATTVGASRLMWSTTPADAARADRTIDPVENNARLEMLSRLPELRTGPAPFLRIDIPEPLEESRLVGLREQPADTDAPVASTSQPPRPVLSK